MKFTCLDSFLICSCGIMLLLIAFVGMLLMLMTFSGNKK